MGNAFVACGVIYAIDSYNNKSTTINFAYDTKLENSGTPTYSSPISTATPPWWPTTPERISAVRLG